MNQLPHPKLTDWALLATLTAFWGSSYALISVALESFPPLTIVMVRMYIGAAICMAWALALGRKVPSFRRADGSFAREWTFFGVMAVVGNVLPFFLISWGQTAVASSLTGILVAIMPLATLALAHVLITHERITLSRLTGYALGFGGIVVLLGVEALGGLGGGATLHQLAVLAGAMCYAMNAIIVRFTPNRDPFMSSAIVALLAAMIATPIALLHDQPWTLAPTWQATAALAVLGITSTGFAGIIYFALIHSAGPTFMSLTNYLSPPFAVVLGVFLLGEAPQASAFIALAMILGGVALSQLQGWKSYLSGREPPAPKE